MGKQVSELVGDDLKVYESGAVTGTFHYVTNYTEFSDAPDEGATFEPQAKTKARAKK